MYNKKDVCVRTFPAAARRGQNAEGPEGFLHWMGRIRSNAARRASTPPVPPSISSHRLGRALSRIGDLGPRPLPLRDSWRGFFGGLSAAGYSGCLQRAAYSSCLQRLSTAAVHSGCLSGCLSGFPFCVKTSQYIAPCSCASAAQGDGGFVMPCAPRRTVSLRAVRSPCGGGATSRETRKEPALPYS